MAEGLLINVNWVEFKLRLCIYSVESESALNNKKCDDLFIVINCEF